MPANDRLEVVVHESSVRAFVRCPLGRQTAAGRVRIAVAAALVLVVVGGDVRQARADGVHALRHDTRVDVAVTATAGIWYVTSELMKASLVPDRCRWCYRAANGTDRLNRYDAGVRRALMWRNAEAAGFASSVLAFFVEPAAMMGLAALESGHDHAIRSFPLDALLITEATVIAGDVNQLVKFSFARERPFVHFLPRAPSGVRALTDSPSDDNTSFFSGHTTLAFALATSRHDLDAPRLSARSRRLERGARHGHDGRLPPHRIG